MMRRRNATGERGRGGWHQRFGQIARHLGWHTDHDNSRKRNKAGRPDFELLRERLVVVELKATGERLKLVQRERLIRYAKAGIEAYAWWPEDEEFAIDVLSDRKPACVDGYWVARLAALPIVGDGRIKRAIKRREEG